MLVNLEEVKEHLNIGLENTSHDNKLTKLVEACTPLIEHQTGPILRRVFDEWYDGGGTFIVLRRRPSRSLGSTPVLNLIACSEYNGPVEWPLALVASPDQGQLYSCMLDKHQMRIVRRTAGGGVQPFPPMPQSVHVVYEAGLEEVPENIRFALMEALREFYQTTMAVGRGRVAQADDDEGPTRSLAYQVSRHVLGMIGPSRRFPSLA
jgi:hypothetical protein